MPFYYDSADRSAFGFWVGSDPRAAFRIFARAYRQAGDTLAGSLLKQPRFAEYEAYPVVFMYRHAFVLILKHILYGSAELAGYRNLEGMSGELRNRHELPALVGAADAALRVLFPGDKSLRSLLRRVRSTGKDLASIDATSYVYRYPMDTSGRPAARSHQTIMLRTFALHMTALLDELDTVTAALSGEIEIAQDALLASLGGFIT